MVDSDFERLVELKADMIATSLYEPRVISTNGNYRLVRQYLQRYPWEGAKLTLELSSTDALGGTCWKDVDSWVVKTTEHVEDNAVTAALLMLGTDLKVTR